MPPLLPHESADLQPGSAPATAPAVSPSSPDDAALRAFVHEFSRAIGVPLETPAALHAASVAHSLAFWRCLAEWAGRPLGWSGTLDPVREGAAVESARFFPALRLNYPASLLNPCVAPDDAIAITECCFDGARHHWTRSDLRTRVAQVAQALSGLGIGPGDRVVAVLRNDASAVVAALAAAAVGATVSTASPDMGSEAIADRFAPLAPRLLFAHAAPRAFDVGQPLPDKLVALGQQLSGLQWLVRLDGDRVPGPWQQHTLEELAMPGDASCFAWPSFPFNHPLFILFSSGTTGRPKCIIHGAGGSLIEHLKEHRLHTGLRYGDRLYFHTSCSWMMWNWQLSALASGVEIVTWDGPVSSAATLWQLAAREQVTVFGTSPAYLRLSQGAGVSPAREFDLRALRAMLSTGAVLHDAQFDWVREHVGTLPLQSISGGTDILGCFLLGHPRLPVRRGEIQCPSLGLDVQAWHEGKPARAVGQLVCANPFPSRPLGFFGDADGSAFHAAYFAENPGLWTHGDLIEFTPSGGARVHGRCDGVLNVRGIKVMPSDICRVIQDAPAVRESMVVERSGDPSRVVALMVLREDAVPGQSSWQPPEVRESRLVAHLRHEIARRLSMAHVPDRFVVVPELPTTHSGKLSESAARCAVNDFPVTNLSALRNPGSLDAIRARAASDGMDRDTQAAVKPSCGRTADGDSLEARLQALWRQQLGLDEVGLDDHFLELGGNSLQAAIIMARLEQMTGRSLPLGTLLQAPTIRTLAALARTSGPQAASGCPVVTLRQGTGAPLVLVHGLSGSVMECWALIDALRTSRPILGLHARGLDGEAPPHQQVQAMAAHYVEALRAHAPRGPYALCGFSFGGLVALEMARLLAQSGQHVALLCLLDSYLRRELPPVLRLWHRCLQVAVKLARLSPAERRIYLSHMATRLRESASMRARRPTLKTVAHAGMSPQHQRVVQCLTQAFESYRPAPYADGPVLFVRARVPLDDHFNPMPLWRRVIRGGLQVVKVPGTHLELVRANGPRVAALIDEALERAPDTAAEDTALREALSPSANVAGA